MVITLCYKVIDLSPHDEDALVSREVLFNHQAEEGRGTGDQLPTHAQSPTGGLHDFACPGPHQHGVGV